MRTAREVHRRYVDASWERLEPGQLRERQWRLISEKLVELAATNDFYRRRWQAEGIDPRRLSGLDDFSKYVPTVTKQDLLADQEETPPFGTFLGVDPQALAEVHLTSGTSGIGQGAFGLTLQDVELSGLGYTHLWTYAGLQPGDVGVLTYPIAFLTGGLIGVAAARTFRLVPLYAAGLDKSRLLMLVHRMSAATIFATPPVLRDLQAEAERIGFDPGTDAASLKAICTGLVMPPYTQIQDIMDFWGVPVFENYGTTEAGNAVAVSCENSLWDGERKYPMHFLGNLFYVEVLDPDSGEHVGAGEPGELVLTTFRRTASPVIRYRSGDRVIFVPSEDCTCGRPFDGIESGEIRRFDDMIKIKGVSVWPQVVDDVVFSFDVIDEYRGIIEPVEHGRDRFILQVAFRSDRRGLTEEVRGNVIADLRQAVKAATFVTPEVVEVPQLEHFQFKMKRWTDRRVQVTSSGAFA